MSSGETTNKKHKASVWNQDIKDDTSILDKCEEGNWIRCKYYVYEGH